MKWHSPHKNRKKTKNKRCNNSYKKIVLKVKSKTATNQNKKHNKKRSIEAFDITLSPLKDFPHFFEDSLQRKFKPTFEFINNFLKGNQYDIDLNYESIDDGIQHATFPIKINQSNRKGVNFEINLPKDFVCRGVRHKEGYGLGESLKIYNNRSSYFIEKGSILNFETTFPHRPLSIKGDFTRIQTFEKLENPTFLRCIIPTNDKDMIFPGYFLNCKPKCILFDIDSLSLHSDGVIGLYMPSTKGHYSELNINGYNILFYGIEVKNNCCLVIDSVEKININDFEDIVYAIRLVYAFLTGRFYKEEKMTLSSNESEFENIEHFSYQMEEESIITDFQIVDFELFHQIADREKNEELKTEYNKYRKGIEPEIFSSMCNMVLSSDEFKRVLELITSAGKNNNPIIQGALYSVALETMTQIIYDENSEALAPMPKDLFKEMRDKLMEVFSPYEEKIDERGKNIINSKILNMNSPTNRDKLEKPFEIMGITLTEEEKMTIETRNKYLHGDEPENSYEWFLKKQLNALDLFDLTARLILKYSKYEGHYFPPQFKYVLNDETAKDIIKKEFDPRKYGEILEKLSKGELTELEEIQDAKKYLQEFMSYAGVISILAQEVRII
ncbi:MAG: hypothetical protein ACLTWE_07950 [Dysgonomonas mossii]|uniref:hypothetical protein n=1 Tax=Dysgonomonas mossii TaxID=163665 RepID=UPI0039931A86